MVCKGPQVGFASVSTRRAAVSWRCARAGPGAVIRIPRAVPGMYWLQILAPGLDHR